MTEKKILLNTQMKSIETAVAILDEKYAFCLHISRDKSLISGGYCKEVNILSTAYLYIHHRPNLRKGVYWWIFCFEREDQNSRFCEQSTIFFVANRWRTSLYPFRPINEFHEQISDTTYGKMMPVQNWDKLHKSIWNLW